MIKNLEIAAKNFCTHQLGIECQNIDNNEKMRTFIAYIDVTSSTKDRHRVFIAANKEFIQKVATMFLEESESDEDTLKDMTLETANLIIGSAKVIAQDSEEAYEIETPFFHNISEFNLEYDEILTLSNEKNKLIIATKEINA